jgi:hypothetical protein
MEKIWFKDLGNFISENNYDNFFPAVSYTYVEKLNSLMRLSIYFSIIAFVIKKDTNILFVPILMAIFTYFLFKSEETSKRANEDFLNKMNLYKDPHTHEICYKPKENNPFMNILMDDYKHNPKRAKACNVSNGNIKKMTTKYFNNNLYRDVGDIFHRNASDRNYYTTPVTTIPNDQDAFLNYAYKIDKTCKEGNGRVCYANTFRTTGN